MMLQVLDGALAGFCATAPMTATMEIWHRRLPARQRYPLPPRLITEKAVRQTPMRGRFSERQQQALSLLSHFGYGAAVGSLYAAACNKTVPPGPATGMAFGTLVWAGSYLGWLPALNILKPATQHPVRRNALMIVAHLVWGSIAGALLRKWNDQAWHDETR